MQKYFSCLFSSFNSCDKHWDRLCGLVVRLHGCRHRGSEFDSQRYQIF
jgi:hypothetical protein